MEQYLKILKNSRLFQGVEEGELEAMFDCMEAVFQPYKKGSFVLHQGQSVRDVLLLLSGKLHVQQEDFWGNSNIISAVFPGELFGEAYLTPDCGAILNNVLAVEDSVVLRFSAQRLLTLCSSSCRFHNRVVQNLFFAVSEKNRQLVQKLGHMSKRSTREKLLSFLSEEAKRQNSNHFTIPFNRQQLADFLSVDRSAMSAELCKLRKDGLIAFDRSEFTLI